MQSFTLTRKLYERLSPSVLALLDWHDRDMMGAAYPYGLNEIMRAPYLTTAEQVELTEQSQKISNLLTEYSDGQDIAVLRAFLFLPMYKIKQVVGKASRQKKEEEERKRAEAEEAERGKAEEERKHQEEERQKAQEAEEAAEKDRQLKAAIGHVYPLQLKKDADRYLSSDDECEEFRTAAFAAIDVYLEKGDAWLDDRRTMDYRFWRHKIDEKKEQERQQIAERKEQERQELAASVTAREYNKGLQEAIRDFKKKLSTQRRGSNTYFNASKPLVDSALYDCLSQEKRNQLFAHAKAKAREDLGELIPADYSDSFDWTNKYWFRFLPIAHYVLEDIPGLAFSFMVEMMIESEVVVQPTKKWFGPLCFPFPMEEHKTKDGTGYSTILVEPELLGYFYTYRMLEQTTLKDWQTIPLVLLSGLLQGQLLPKNTKVIEEQEKEIVYEIKGSDDFITIPSVFRAWLVANNDIQSWVTAGSITEQTAQIIMEQTPELKSPPIDKTASLQTRDSRKDKAFQLFSEGKRPSDPEVKTLGIKANSAYRYYQDWKKAHNSSKNPT